MNTIWMIASGTFGEARRRKILNGFRFVALALMVMGFAFASFSPKEEMVIIKSLGLGVIGLAGVFISVILFINLVPTEIERRTIYTILSKPVQRYEFLLGKFVGGLMTVFVNIAFMGLAFVLLVAWKGNFSHEALQGCLDCLKGILMIFFQLVILGGVGLCFSVFLSPFVNFFLSFALYLLGSMGVLESLSTPNKDQSPIATGFFKGLHYIVPNFGNFNIQNPIIHPDVIIKNESIYIAQNVLYAIIYTAILLIISVMIFDRKEV
jgi:ABC-type transport system involved in multi-copper enzyme maturation permease subunit